MTTTIGPDSERDLLLGRMRHQLATLTHERDSWQHAAEQAARNYDALALRLRDVEAARDALQEQVRELLATPRILHDATDPGPQLVAKQRALAPFPLRALRVSDGIVR